MVGDHQKRQDSYEDKILSDFFFGGEIKKNFLHNIFFGAQFNFYLNTDLPKYDMEKFLRWFQFFILFLQWKYQWCRLSNGGGMRKEETAPKYHFFSSFY